MVLRGSFREFQIQGENLLGEFYGQIYFVSGEVNDSNDNWGLAARVKSLKVVVNAAQATFSNEKSDGAKAINVKANFEEAEKRFLRKPLHVAVYSPTLRWHESQLNELNATAIVILVSEFK